jgi:gamma-glutamylcysteine synthetase
MLPISDIAALPAEHLALLQEDAAAALEASKKAKDWIDGAIALRFADHAQSLRREAGKDTGTVRFEQDAVTVVADLPKRVDWDQTLIAGVVERIRAAGDDPTQYVDIAIKVPERKYTAWPENIRAAFAPARTVRTGKPSFILTLKEHP